MVGDGPDIFRNRVKAGRVRTPMRPHPLRAAAALLAILAASAGPAQAALIETPLRLNGDRSDVQAGDRVNFTVDAANETARAAWAGKTVQVAWEEIQTGDPGGAQPAGGAVQDLALDAKAHATFVFTVPQAADDKNIFVVLRSGDERLAQFHLRVGDAEAIAFTLGGPGGGPAGEPEPEPGPTDQTGGANGSGQPRGQSRTPGFEVLAAIAGLGAVAVLVARRRA